MGSFRRFNFHGGSITIPLIEPDNIVGAHQSGGIIVARELRAMGRKRRFIDFRRAKAHHMTDLVRPHLLAKVRSAGKRLAEIEYLDVEEQRRYRPVMEGELKRAKRKLDDYDQGVRASQTVR